MDIELELAVERFEEESKRRRIPLEEFRRSPFHYLSRVRDCDGEIYLTNEGKTSFVVIDAKKFFKMSDDYFEACLKAGVLDPELARIVKQGQLLKEPTGNA